MASINRATIIGNLGADPEVRKFDGGTVTATIRVATSEKFTNREGQKVEETEWHRIEFWGKLAEVVEQYVKKGDSVYVEGKIKTEKYTDKDGIERYATKIRANVLQMLGRRDPNADSQQRNQVTGAQTPEIQEDEDLPF